MAKKAIASNRVIAAIRTRITAMDWVCSGTIQKRTQTCGKATCRCARDPAARHGPYFAWGRMEDGRFKNTVVSPRQAHLLAQAIKNHRTIVTLLRQWTRETARKLGVRK